MVAKRNTAMTKRNVEKKACFRLRNEIKICGLQTCNNTKNCRETICKQNSVTVCETKLNWRAQAATYDRGNRYRAPICLSLTYFLPPLFLCLTGIYQTSLFLFFRIFFGDSRDSECNSLRSALLMTNRGSRLLERTRG